MKHTLAVILVTFFFNLDAQRNKQPKMEPVYTSGYYVTTRNDTVRGDIRVNVEDITDIHKQFWFKSPKVKKARAFDARRAKAYGFDDRHFVAFEIDEQNRFLERVTNGRLRLFEYKFHGKKDGYDAIETAFLIRDAWADGTEPEKQQLKRISTKFYKRSLKPYIADEQPDIWTDLDKYNFNRGSMVNAVREFNSRYPKQQN